MDKVTQKGRSWLKCTSKDMSLYVQKKGISREEDRKVESMSFVYLLRATDGSTYVGATVDLQRRIRQHNREIQGGARYTGSKVERGHRWTRIAHIAGFPSWQAALQCEWRWKQLTRRQRSGTPVYRRIAALVALMGLERATCNAVPFAEWSPQLVLEDDEARSLFQRLQPTIPPTPWSYVSAINQGLSNATHGPSNATVTQHDESVINQGPIVTNQGPSVTNQGPSVINQVDDLKTGDRLLISPNAMS